MNHTSSFRQTLLLQDLQSPGISVTDVNNHRLSGLLCQCEVPTERFLLELPRRAVPEKVQTSLTNPYDPFASGKFSQFFHGKFVHILGVVGVDSHNSGNLPELFRYLKGPSAFGQRRAYCDNVNNTGGMCLFKDLFQIGLELAHLQVGMGIY